MSAITIDHDLVHYEVLGRGRPVIFLHGWLGSWRYWVPAMRQLSTKYRAYAIDLWGFGDSGKDVRRFGLAAQVMLLSEFMDKMGIAKAALVGHDLGAAVAAHYAVRHADRVPRLLAVCPPLFKIESGVIDVLPKAQPRQDTIATEAETIPKPTDEMRARLEAALEQRAREIGEAAMRARALREATRLPVRRPASDPVARLPDLPDLLKENPLPGPPAGENPVWDHLGGLDWAALLDKHVEPGPDLDKLKAEAAKADPRVLAANIASLAGVDTLGALKALAMPLVAVYGADDTLLPAPDDGMLAALRENHKPFHAVCMADIHHFPMLENVAAFNRLLLDFLEAPDVTKLEIKKQWERRVR